MVGIKRQHQAGGNGVVDDVDVGVGRVMVRDPRRYQPDSVLTFMRSPRTSRSPVRKRLDYIDVLRGVGLLCMVVDHAYDWWLVEAANRGPWGRATEFIGTLAAPIFLVLVGVSMVLATDSRRTQGALDRQLVWRFIQRGLMIALWGYVVNLSVFFNGDNWRDVFAFDVLQCIGLGIVLFAPVAVWAPTWALLPLALVLGWGGQYAEWLMLPGYLGTVVNGSPDIAYFPLLPWLCYIPAGILWGWGLLRWRDNVRELDRLVLALVPIGLVLLVASAFVPPTLGYRHPWAAFILFSFSIVAWLAVGLYVWCRVAGGRLGRFLGWLRDTGCETLMLYILHHLIGFRLLYWLGGVTGRSWRGQYGAFTIPQATALLVTLLGVMVVVTRAWSRWKAKPGVWQHGARIFL